MPLNSQMIISQLELGLPAKRLVPKRNNNYLHDSRSLGPKQLQLSSHLSFKKRERRTLKLIEGPKILTLYV